MPIAKSKQQQPLFDLVSSDEDEERIDATKRVKGGRNKKAEQTINNHDLASKKDQKIASSKANLITEVANAPMRYGTKDIQDFDGIEDEEDDHELGLDAQEKVVEDHVEEEESQDYAGDIDQGPVYLTNIYELQDEDGQDLQSESPQDIKVDAAWDWLDNAFNSHLLTPLDVVKAPTVKTPRGQETNEDTPPVKHFKTGDFTHAFSKSPLNRSHMHREKEPDASFTPKYRGRWNVPSKSGGMSR